MKNNELLDEIKTRFNELNKLEKINNELNDKLISLNDKLKESEKLKTNFISNVMNELVNPFSSILGLSENIMHLEDPDLQQSKKIASMIYNEAFNIDFHLSNIFTAARIEAGELSLFITNVDIVKLIKNLVSDNKYKIEKQKLKVTVNTLTGKEMESLSHFKTDNEKIKIIFNNLLNNAIKYSPEGKTIKINVSFENGTLAASFTDEGKGFPVDKINEIFDRFKQLNSSVHNLNPGQGLGLSVVKALIDLLDGQIAASSDQKGSTFTIKLPEMETDETGSSADLNEMLF